MTSSRRCEAGRTAPGCTYEELLPRLLRRPVAESGGRANRFTVRLSSRHGVHTRSVANPRQRGAIRLSESCTRLSPRGPRAPCNCRSRTPLRSGMRHAALPADPIPLACAGARPAPRGALLPGWALRPGQLAIHIDGRPKLLHFFAQLGVLPAELLNRQQHQARGNVKRPAGKTTLYDISHKSYERTKCYSNVY